MDNIRRELSLLLQPTQISGSHWTKELCFNTDRARWIHRNFLRQLQRIRLHHLDERRVFGQ